MGIQENMMLTSDCIILSSITLHNFSRDKKKKSYSSKFTVLDSQI